MIQEAIASDDPVIFFEPKSRYWQKGEVDLAPARCRCTPAAIVRDGTDVTLVGHGAMVTTLLQAAGARRRRRARASRSSTCARSRPIDYGPILDSVRRPAAWSSRRRRPASRQRRLRDRRDRHRARLLLARGARAAGVGGFDTPFPPAKLEGAYLPDADRVLEAVDRALAY